VASVPLIPGRSPRRTKATFRPGTRRAQNPGRAIVAPGGLLVKMAASSVARRCLQSSDGAFDNIPRTLHIRLSALLVKDETEQGPSATGPHIQERERRRIVELGEPG
jgi:hypothetical protein